ncbi:hypothetical protein NADFUDRAFT_83523 [Nadsonia fulvescens var. elongata DSM 6958]|uniref:Calponin-homology (CH) domain-containing protein n=1 Tax=Nadsonia fulvescens var. elongata DSM 6958 TaxID=857566 RepID=A0A1E3PGL3_9ASCO|nr:hypothetical protein NADFUDRAFT_83523 [Nadsonia fulvescens var. elongata DSM 6958]
MSVSSLDADLKVLRNSKYDPNMADQLKFWLSNVIDEALPDGDLIDILRDGVYLCKLASIIFPGDVKYKKSAMPFVQMENIQTFLTVAKTLGIPSQELFQTIDLYESQDSAQVLLTLMSFSRYAHEKIPSVPSLGPKLSTPTKPRSHAFANAGADIPAWNTIQYGYMKGASQGTEGLVFGAKRDIIGGIGTRTDNQAQNGQNSREKISATISTISNTVDSKKKIPPPIPPRKPISLTGNSIK